MYLPTPNQRNETIMKLSIATPLVIAASVARSASAFAPAAGVSTTTKTALAMADGDVPLANGAMSFNRVCREWRCKYDGDKATSASLEAIAKLVDENLPDIKKSLRRHDGEPVDLWW